MINVFLGLCADNLREEYIQPALEIVKNYPLKTIAARLEAGFYTERDFVVIIAERARLSGKERTGIPATLLRLTLRRFMEYGLVLEGPPGGLEANYQFVPLAMAGYAAMGILENIACGPSFMVETRRQAIPAINVRHKTNGKISCGTGALSMSADQHFILTNRHVVDGYEIDEIIGGGEKYLQEGEISLCDYADLAIIPVKKQGSIKPFVLTSPDVMVLTPVISVGYPQIPFAAEQTLLAHRGEVNGTVSTLKNETYFAISNYVRPGNSGGPLLTEHGMIAGIIAQSNEADNGDPEEGIETYRTVYHLAIPSSICYRFIEQTITKSRKIDE